MAAASTIFLVFFIFLALIVLSIRSTLLILLAGLVAGARQTLKLAARGLLPQPRQPWRALSSYLSRALPSLRLTFPHPRL